MSQIQNPSPAGRLLPPNVVAQRLGKSQRTIRWYAKTGRLEATRVGRKLWKYRDADVEAFKRSCRTHSEAM
jgi:excisionase family DNA binding protein